MTSPFERQDNDFGLHSIPPRTSADPRVRLAEEDSLQAWITEWLVKNSRMSGWLTPPDVAVDNDSRLTIQGQFASQIYPSGVMDIDAGLLIPPLDSNTSIVKRTDQVYLVLFGAIVGGDQDVVLGQVNFQYIDRSTSALTPVQKENAKRDRVYWCLAITSGELTPESFNALLPTEPLATGQVARITGDRYLPVANTTETGFVIGSVRLYALDPKFVLANYPVKKDFIECIPVCQILRIQNYTDRGYMWGRNGEDILDRKFNILPISPPPPKDLDALIRRRLIDVFSNVPGPMSAFSRTVQNLTAGFVPGNPGRVGESAAAPNGSVCLANDDRITFTNQAFLQTNAVQIVSASNDGNGNAIVTAQLNNSAPAGTFFSETPGDHRIYKGDGTEQSGLGRFINLGGTGSLIWIADQNSTIKPGEQVYFVPAVKYPAGSGLAVPFERVEQVWLNGAPLQPQNIRMGWENDLDAYQTPASPDRYFAVVGTERAALHYILKKVTIQTSSTGVAAIPATERGCFAFIEGVAGRINAPLKTGLTPNTTYNALVYYPPRTLENWQLQLSYCPYQGTSAIEPDFLDGAMVVSKPYCFLTTQGGGSSVFQADAALRYSPVSMNLPLVDTGIPIYSLDAPIRYVNEANPGPITFREASPFPGAGLALPSPGMRLSLSANTGLASGQSINASLLSNGKPLGFKTPVLYKRVNYQAILAFMVQRGHEHRLVIATHTGAGNEDIAIDSNAGTAFDTFRV